MKIFLPTLLFLLFLASCGSSDSIFELDPNQSMLMTGKGPGQDAAINPYTNEKSIAIVTNLGDTVFSVRIQHNGEILNDSPLLPGVTREYTLEPGYELYLDSEQKSRSKVTFKAFKE